MGGNITELKTTVQNTGNFFYNLADLLLTATLFRQQYLPDDIPHPAPHRYLIFSDHLAKVRRSSKTQDSGATDSDLSGSLLAE